MYFLTHKSFFQSPKKFTEYNQVVDRLEKEKVKLRTIFEVRWLSMGEAVTSLLRNYEALLRFTEEESAKGHPTAMGLKTQLSSYLNAALLHLA